MKWKTMDEIDNNLGESLYENIFHVIGISSELSSRKLKKTWSGIK